MKIENSASIKAYNTFGIDAQASKLAKAESKEDILELLEYTEVNKIPLFILGGGSNILFTKTINELVLLNRVRGIQVVDENSDAVWVEAMAGENWHEFVMHCIKNDWAGIENLSLIPGNVGASPMQNIGAYGVEIKDVFHSLKAINRKTGEVKTFNGQECEFGYRESIFKQREKSKWIIYSVTFKLSKKKHEYKTEYGAIINELDAMGITQPSIRSISNAVINIRQSKLPNPAELGNAGSFFKNPVVDNGLVEEIRKQYPNVVSYPAGDNNSKLAAGWLIENAGWKGFREGDAGVHAKQALVLVNYGKAKGNEIQNLADRIIADIKSKYGVHLEQEVNKY